MALTKEQADDVRNQLLGQIKNVPEESREEVRKQIESMTPDQMEEFLKKNQQMDDAEGKCIFCSIAEGKTPSIKIDENEEAIAVMDINPISKGHVLVIPKAHGEDPKEKSQELAFKVGGKILEELKPKDITTRGAKIGDHTILNVIPIYEDTDFEKRIKVDNKELLDIAKKISNKKIAKDLPKTPEKDQPKEIIKERKEEPPACIFCSISGGHTPSFEIDENKDNTAILEINPISRGHSLVIPKKHIDTTELPANSFTLAKKIAKKIKNKYKPNDVKINPTTMNNHAVIELIPLYEDTDISKREQASEEDLKQMQKDLKVKRSQPSPKPKITTPKKPKEDDIKVRSNKGSFNLPKRPKYPDLVQFGPRIP